MRITDRRNQIIRNRDQALFVAFTVHQQTPATVTRLQIIKNRPRNPWLQPWGGKGGYTFRWFSTYCLTTARVAPPTVATK
jgi:hypothetical protein